MQNYNAPQDTSHGADQLHALCEEIEVTWNARRDATVVDRLAADHPELAGALYEFFGLLVQAELDLDQPDPALAEHDTRAEQRLEFGGFAEAAEIAQREGAFASRTELQMPLPGASPESWTPPLPSATSPIRPAEPAPPARPSAGDAARPTSDPSEIVTPVADLSAAGVPAGGACASQETSVSWRQRGRRPRPRTFLSRLIDTSGETPDAIAARLGVNANLLVGIDGLGDRVPVRVRQEFARRATEQYGLPPEQLLALFGSGPMPMAASRGKSYDRPLTYDEVVRRSKLPFGDEAFWLSLID